MKWFDRKKVDNCLTPIYSDTDTSQPLSFWARTCLLPMKVCNQYTIPYMYLPSIMSSLACISLTRPLTSLSAFSFGTITYWLV